MSAEKGVKFGFFLKFLFSFVLLAAVAICVIGYLWGYKTKKLCNTVITQSNIAITDLAKTNIRQRAIDVAKQLEVYFRAHKNVDIEKFKSNPYLESIAVQPIGKSGFTTVYTTEGIVVFHRNPKKIGFDLHVYGKKSPAYWRIIEKSLKGKASGYYEWIDGYHRFHKRYMFCQPVKGTNLVVAASTSMDEFYRPFDLINRKINTNWGIIFSYLLIGAVGFIILIVVISIIHARRISNQIRYLSYVADRIGVGDIEVGIDLKAKDEFAILIEAMDRMRKSLKISILRLQTKSNLQNGSS